MRHLVLLSLGALLTSVGFAQQGSLPLFFGASVGIAHIGSATVPVLGTVGGTTFGISFQVGVEDVVVENLNIRTALSIGFASQVTLLRLAVDALYDFDIGVGTNLPLTPYAGGGLRLGTAGQLRFGVGAVAGAEFNLASQVSAFGEVTLDIINTGLANVVPGISLGVNFRP